MDICPPRQEGAVVRASKVDDGSDRPERTTSCARSALSPP
jgi:hypothetical protein